MNDVSGGVTQPRSYSQVSSSIITSSPLTLAELKEEHRLKKIAMKQQRREERTRQSRQTSTA